MEDNILQGQQKELKIKENRVIHQSDILSGTIKERHLGANLYVTKFGLEANLPSEPTYNRVYFATDTDTLYIYNGSSWVSTVLS